VQVTGRMFQAAFRSRKIPFNVHGVAFYRKKVNSGHFLCHAILKEI